MVNKQGLWFLTLFSLILVLSVYYITMPNEVFKTQDVIEETNKQEEKEETKTKEEKVNSENTSYIETLKIELASERTEILETLQSVLNDKTKTSDEKNKAYEEMKEINNVKANEESIIKKIKEKHSLNAYVKQDDNNIEIVVEGKEHDIKLANSIMRTVQSQFDEKMNISIKFS